jgi:hypothetical protein
VFFFDPAHQVGGVAELRLNLFLAVTVVVIRDQGDDDAGSVAARQFERHAVVVLFVRVAITHRIGSLARRRGVVMRQAEFLFGQVDQVRSQDDAAGVAAPVINVQARVIFRYQRVARVAENRLDKVEIADQRSGGEKTDLHRFFMTVIGHVRPDDRAQ